MKFRTSEPNPGRLRSVTVSIDRARRYWARSTADGSDTGDDAGGVQGVARWATVDLRASAR